MDMKSAIGTAACLVAVPLLAALYPDFGRVEGLDFAEIGPAEYRPLRRELRTFYPRECHDPPKSAKVAESFTKIHRLASEWSETHPGHSALELRRHVYSLEREHFVPVLFRESPFYFETGLNGGYHRGDGKGETPPPGRVTRVLCNRFFKEQNLIPDEAFARRSARAQHMFGIACGVFVDEVHDLPPFHAVFTKGFGGIRKDVSFYPGKGHTVKEKNHAKAAQHRHNENYGKHTPANYSHLP